MKTIASTLFLLAGLFTVPLLRASYADTIYLKSGQRLEVESWRDVGDEIEFSRFGGIMRIPKSDIERVEGKSASNTLEMYSALDAREMLSLVERALRLSWESEEEEFRPIITRWRQARPPASLRDVYARGAKALERMASNQMNDRFVGQQELIQLHRVLQRSLGEGP